MQFKNSRNTSRAVVIDMTPMIDIVFQLLIFFLVTAQMAQQTRATLDLPKEKGEETKETEQAGLTINVLADGSVVECYIFDRRAGATMQDSVVRGMLVGGGEKQTIPYDRITRLAFTGKDTAAGTRAASPNPTPKRASSRCV